MTDKCVEEYKEKAVNFAKLSSLGFLDRICTDDIIQPENDFELEKWD